MPPSTMKSKSPLIFRPKIENDEHDDDEDDGDKDGNRSIQMTRLFRSKEEGSFINDHSARNFSASASPEASKYSRAQHQQQNRFITVMHGNDLPMHRAQFRGHFA